MGCYSWETPMVMCNVCCHWEPTQWDNVSKYLDMVAPCILKGTHTTSRESCTEGRVVPCPAKRGPSRTAVSLERGPTSLHEAKQQPVEMVK
jgi:hypothetical protein